jgi:hypothetical protein
MIRGWRRAEYSHGFDAAMRMALPLGALPPKRMTAGSDRALPNTRSQREISRADCELPLDRYYQAPNPEGDDRLAQA